MLPMSPPLPLIHKTVALLPSSGSVPSILELVFPPPKFVMRRSDPNKLDRYLSNSAPSRVLATWSSQRSSRYRSFSLDFMGKTIVGFHASKLPDKFWFRPTGAYYTIRSRKKDCNRLILSIEE